jgi:hypothetical protein
VVGLPNKLIPSLICLPKKLFQVAASALQLKTNYSWREKSPCPAPLSPLPPPPPFPSLLLSDFLLWNLVPDSREGSWSREMEQSAFRVLLLSTSLLQLDECVVLVTSSGPASGPQHPGPWILLGKSENFLVTQLQRPTWAALELVAAQVVPGSAWCVAPAAAAATAI